MGRKKQYNAYVIKGKVTYGVMMFVTAENAEEASAKADAGPSAWDCEPELQEMRDWEATGEPELNE
jgi:hypothetical protein